MRLELLLSKGDEISKEVTAKKWLAFAKPWMEKLLVERPESTGGRFAPPAMGVNGPLGELAILTLYPVTPGVNGQERIRPLLLELRLLIFDAVTTGGGGVTVTSKVPVTSWPYLSVAETITLEVPTEKTEPEAGSEETGIVAPVESVAEIGKETVATGTPAEL